MNMGRYIRSCFVGFTAFMMLFLLNFTVYADNPHIEEVIRVGYVPGYGIITAPGEEAEKGYGYEYLTEIAKYTGWSYEFIPCEWTEGMDMLRSGEIDFFGPLEKTPEREAEFYYPEREMGKEYGGLFIQSDNKKYGFEDAKSFDGMRVGTEKNNFFNRQMEEYCEKNGISVRYVETEFGSFSRGLKNDDYDGVLIGSIMTLPDTVIAAKISLEPYYYVTSKDKKVLGDILDDAIGQIEMNNVYFESKLYNKYYKGNPVENPAFTRAEKEFIEKNPVIWVVSDPNWAPIEYVDKKTGQNKGISVDILKELGRISGIDFRFAPAANYQDCKQLLKSGEVSLILPHTESAKDLGVSYTIPFFHVSTTLVGRSDIDVSQPLRVGVSNIQSQPARELMKTYPQFEMIAYDNTNELLKALRSGKEDVIFVNTFVYDDVVRGENGRMYRALPMDITYPIRAGVSITADKNLLGVLNKSIGRMSDGKINSVVFANTVNRAYHVPLPRFLRENMYLALGVLASVFTLLVLLITYTNRKNRKALETIAYVDELTGLPTYTKFHLDTARIVNNNGPSGLMLASLDVDNFKYINDVFGYDMGNRILQSMARHFLGYPQAYNLIGRNGSDNFIFLIQSKDKEEAFQAFSQMMDVNEDLRSLLPANYNFVLSAGIYVLSGIDSDEVIASWCDKANIARKSVKGRHKSTLQEYTPEMDVQIRWKKEVTLSMEEALRHEDFKVYLQPKYHFDNGNLAGAEALARWQHPREGLLSPISFIPLFERNGFILKLDLYMFRQVCRLLRGWKDEGLDTPTISVNLSRLHLSNENLVEDLLDITREHQVEPSMIQIELTESIVLDNSLIMIEVLSRLRDVGFEISVDDFGSGYSSLNLLTDLPVDVLKLDKGFLQKMSKTGNSRLIVEHVIELAKKLHLSTVAEGVETREQVEILRRMGCDVAQGYYYARPMPVESFYEVLKVWNIRNEIKND